MTDAINAAIDGGTCAEQALMDTSTMFENMFLSMDDEMFRLRAADIADIRTGILAELLGKEVVDLSVLPENTVVVVHDLTPSMTATIDKARCRYRHRDRSPHVALRDHRARPRDSGCPFGFQQLHRAAQRHDRCRRRWQGHRRGRSRRGDARRLHRQGAAFAAEKASSRLSAASRP